MKAMRIGLFCALIGWTAAAAEAQWGTYGSPDPIPLGQYAPQDASQPAAVHRTAYLAATDGSDATAPLPPAGRIPDPPSERSAVTSMLNEPGPSVAPSPGVNMLPPGGYLKDAGNCDNCGDNCVCGCGCGCDSPWYASAEALFMTRSQPARVYTSTFPAPPDKPVYEGCFNDVNWTWGGQGTIGYRFGANCQWAAEVTYWDLAQSCSDGGPNIPGSCPYGTPMNFTAVNMLCTSGGLGTGGLQTATQWFDGAAENHTWRSYDAENLEGNLVRTLCGGPCSRFDVDFLVGVRWFHFNDDFLFGAQRADDGSAYANQWIYLNDHITNDLVGAQAGFNASYRFGDCWKVFLKPRFGIYDNHMSLDYNLYAVNGATVYQGSSQTCGSPNYPVHASTDGFAFLTQVDLGMDWQFSRHVGAELGYRVMAMTGMGLSDSQIPFNGNATDAIADIKHGDGLLLHGAFGGLTFTW